jgi:hypothetical protein
VSKGIGQWTGGKVPQVLDTWLHAYGLTSFNVGQHKQLSYSCCNLSNECIVHWTKQLLSRFVNNWL